MAKRRVRTASRSGAIPRLARALWRSIQWLWRHPQPVFALLLVIGGGAALWRVVTTSDAFQVTDIRVPEDSGLKVSKDLVGQNLWHVDVRRLADELSAQRPAFKRIRVIRRPPHTLEIEVLERAPIAQLQLGKWYAVDLDGFILPDGRAKPFEALPILKGLHEAKGTLKAGRDNRAPRLQEALRIVALLRESEALCGRHISVIDVSDGRQVRFVLGESLEVRCGEPTELSVQLARLRPILQIVAQRQLAASYIDVRFQDPVIGAKSPEKRRI